MAVTQIGPGGFVFHSLIRFRGVEYPIFMKRPPNNPEFAKFTEAMRTIMTVPKADIQEALKREKRKPKASASRVSAVPPKRVN
jgi:hypothetical protein